MLDSITFPGHYSGHHTCHTWFKELGMAYSTNKGNLKLCVWIHAIKVQCCKGRLDSIFWRYQLKNQRIAPAFDQERVKIGTPNFNRKMLNISHKYSQLQCSKKETFRLETGKIIFSYPCGTNFFLHQCIMVGVLHQKPRW